MCCCMNQIQIGVVVIEVHVRSMCMDARVTDFSDFCGVGKDYKSSF